MNLLSSFERDLHTDRWLDAYHHAMPTTHALISRHFQLV